jgi:hypothetical protein
VRTLVLIDPSSPDGEGGLSMIGSGDDAVSMLLTLCGPASTSLHEYAAAEQLAGLGREGLARLVRLCPVPVVVAPSNPLFTRDEPMAS